jgi:hypothetical protein
MARTSGTSRGRGRKTISILVDGETELWYLQMLRRTENIPGVTLRPDLPQAKKLIDQFEEVKRNAKEFDFSVWILDLDVIIRERAIDELDHYQKQLADIKNVYVLVNTPCLEFWFYQHFKDSGRYFPDCDSVMREFKSIPVLKDYGKTKKYFVENTPNIYDRLKPHLGTGISNAAKRGKFDSSKPHVGLAEMHSLFKILNFISK